MMLIQMLLNPPLKKGEPIEGLVKRFSPTEILETIQSLVATEQLELANALGDAGLAIYPHSEDILAITSLLATVNQDWQLAVELLDQLIEMQGNSVKPFTYVMMVRALRCNSDPARAMIVARQGLAIYPNQYELLAEKLSLDDFNDCLMPESSSSYQGSSYSTNTATRLNELKTLLDQKLISPDEYEKKRRKIIDDI